MSLPEATDLRKDQESPQGSYEILKQANTDALPILQAATGLIEGGGQKAFDLKGRIRELSHVRDLLTQAGPFVGQARRAASEIETQWSTRIVHDSFQNLPFSIYSYGALQHARSETTANLTKWQTARFGGFRFRDRIKAAQTVLSKLDEYESAYKKEVDPYKKTAKNLEEEFDVVRKQEVAMAQTVAENAVKEVSVTIGHLEEGGKQAVSDPVWREKEAREYLDRSIGPTLQKAVTEGNIDELTAQEIRAFVAHYFKEGVPTTDFWHLARDQQDQAERKQDEYKTRRNELDQKIREKIPYGLDGILQRVGLGGTIQPGVAVFDHVAKMITNLVSDGLIDEVSQAVSFYRKEEDYGTRSGWDLEQSLSHLRMRLDFTSRKPFLRDIQGIDRWQTVARQLIDHNVITSQEVIQAEERLIWDLTRGVLIPGGHESWDGTAVTNILADLGNPKSLEALLYYQGLTAGPAGLYQAGHTNNAADYAREALMTKLGDADIEALDSPRFIKRMLMAFKHPDQSNLVSPEYKEAWAALDGYAKARLTAEMFGRQFKEILEEIKGDSSINRGWVTVALRGVGAVLGELSENDYTLLSQIAIETQDQYEKTEILRTLCERVKGIDVSFSHFEQTDADFAAQAVLDIISQPEYKVDDEHLIALFKACNHLGIKLKFPAFAKADREKAALRAEQVGDKIASWLEQGDLTERQTLIAIQALDVLENPKYGPVLYKQASRLLFEPGLEERYNYENRQIYGSYGDKIIMLKDWNRHSVYETIGDILLRVDFALKYRPTEEVSIVDAFRANPGSQKGINELYRLRYEEMDADPQRKERYISSYVELITKGMVDDEVAQGMINHVLEWRIDYLNCQTSLELVANALKTGGETGRKFLPLAAELTRRYSHIKQHGHPDEGKQLIWRKLAESCPTYLSSEKILDKYNAVMALASIEWESDEMRQAVMELYRSEEPLGKKSPKPRDIPQFMEIYNFYSTENKDILILRSTLGEISEGLDFAPKIREAIQRLSHRAERGSTVSDYELLLAVAGDMADPGIKIRALYHGMAKCYPEGSLYYNELISGSLFEKIDDESVRAPLLEAVKAVVAQSFSDSFGENGKVTQVDLVRRLISGIKEARQEQRINDQQITEIVSIIKSNEDIYRQALRSL